MFLEVKRIKQKLDIEECKYILEHSLRGVLSINGLNGYPYGMPLNHYYSKEENRLYFHGGKIGYKIDCIKKDNRCSYCIYLEDGLDDTGWALNFKSVIVFGKIHFVCDIEEIKRISTLLSYKFTNDNDYINYELKNSINNTAMYYIEIEHITGKKVNEK